MKFGLFYAGELLHAFTFGGFLAILFFGGYRFFGLENWGPLVATAIFMLKAMFGYWVMMWIRYTVMRIRIDQMLAFNWKFLTPLAFLVLVITAVLKVLLKDAAPWIYIGAMLLSNILVGWITVEILRVLGRKQRETLEARPVAHGAHQ
jgi:NADH-quinone oxidoreductase subunit H